MHIADVLARLSAGDDNADGDDIAQNVVEAGSVQEVIVNHGKFFLQFKHQHQDINPIHHLSPPPRSPIARGGHMFNHNMHYPSRRPKLGFVEGPLVYVMQGSFSYLIIFHI